MALVVVLVFVPLVSVLLVAYLQKASGTRQLAFIDANQSTARLLTRSALAVIVSDIRRELAVDVPPKIPWRSGRNPLHPNLIRESLGGEPAYPGGPVRSAADPSNSSLRPSLNGRALDPKRWNKSYLLTRASSASPSDTTPQEFAAPDWVLVTRCDAGLDQFGQTLEDLSQMTDVAPSNPNKVLGRFAYMIFDEGGLLDVNVAGCPSGIGAAQASRKGTLAFADLARLGLSMGVPNQVDRLIGWRNFATARPGREPGGNFYNYDFTRINDGKTAVAAYFDAVIAGRLEAARTGTVPIFEGSTDQRFVGRQQLLQFRRATGFSDRALQYLGCFSRELNVPSFAPDPRRPELVGDAMHGGNDAFDPHDRRADRINPALLAVRVGAGGFIRNDGSAALEGEPLVAERFALSRLAWVTCDGPSAESGGDPRGTAENIRKYFGLRWDPAGREWVYLNGASRTIACLEEVRALGREPDFFELLKAGIAAGSLGKSAPRSNETGIHAANLLQRQRDSSLERQLFQIGANILDQADNDSFPTRLRIGTDHLWGSEDLPGIYRLHLEAVRVGAQTAVAMIEPELWNPYDWRSTPCSRGPTRFRITLEAQSVQFQGPVSGRGIPITPANSALECVLPLSDHATFRHPTLVRHGAAFFPGPDNLDGAVLSRYNICESGTAAVFALEQPGPASQIVGFKVGDIEQWPAAEMVSASLIAPGGLKVSMEYADNGWRKCQEIEFPSVEDDGLSMAWPFGCPGGLGSRVAVLCDPRTDRFGVLWASTLAYPVRSFTECAKEPILASGTNLLHESMRPEAGADQPAGYAARFDLLDGGRGQGWTGDVDRFFTGCLSENATRSPAYYADADGVVRRAMGAYAGSTGLLGLPMATPLSAGDWSNRPFMLNRPFRNVAELGCVFRGSPWKNLDFFTPESGDAALLDLFCVKESQRIVSGRVNTRHVPVLKAVLAGTAKDPWSYLSEAELERLAELVVRENERLGNMADLVALSGALGDCYDDGGVLQRTRESALRALADVGSVRAWNLMIDLVAQSGHFVRGATRLDQFVVEAEERVWVHLAIDRFTGEVLDLFSENVTE